MTESACSRGIYIVLRALFSWELSDKVKGTHTSSSNLSLYAKAFLQSKESKNVTQGTKLFYFLAKPWQLVNSISIAVLLSSVNIVNYLAEYKLGIKTLESHQAQTAKIPFSISCACNYVLGTIYQVVYQLDKYEFQHNNVSQCPRQ